MQLELRPLSLGEILDRTFQLYRARFPLFVGMASLAAACQMILGALQNIALRRMQVSPHTPVVLTAWSSISSFVILAFTVVCYTVVFAAITRAVTAIYLDEPTSVRKAYADILPRWFRYLRLAVTAGLLAWWPVIVLGVLLVSAVALNRHSGAGSAALLTGLVIFILILVGLPLSLWLLVRYSLAQPACVTEGLPVRSSLRRSVLLSAGLRWRIFLLLLIGYIFQSILTLVLTSPTIAAIMHAHGHVPLWAVVYNLVAAFCINSLAVPVYGIGLTLFYFDARIRKEGFDIELLLNRMSPAEAAVPADTATGAPGLSIG